MVEMKARSRHTWFRVQGPNESVKFYTRIPGIIELGRSKIEKATGNFETLIRLLNLTQMIHKPLAFKLGRNWYSQDAERDFQTRQAARRPISEFPTKALR